MKTRRDWDPASKAHLGRGDANLGQEGLGGAAEVAVGGGVGHVALVHPEHPPTQRGGWSMKCGLN